MAKLTIFAHITAHPDKADLVKAELEKLVPVTRTEDGCVRYDLHQDNDDRAHFMFYETWETRDLWQAHMAAPHISAFGVATDGAVADFQLFEMTETE